MVKVININNICMQTTINTRTTEILDGAYFPQFSSFLHSDIDYICTNFTHSLSTFMWGCTTNDAEAISNQSVPTFYVCGVVTFTAPTVMTLCFW